MKQASFRAHSLFFLLLLGISTLWGQQPPHAAMRSGHWRLVGTGDCPDHDVGQTSGSNPAEAHCGGSSYGYTAVCWSGNCTYKNVQTGSCTGGANPGRMYTCEAATSSSLMARIDPAESEVESGGGVKMKAIVSGGAPPYSYEWRNGEQLSKVTGDNINFSNLNTLGDRDIRLTVRDAARNTVETHAAIHVHAGQTNAPTQIPPEPIAPTLPPAVESAFFRTVNIAGTWQPGARGETWTFTALGGDRYRAVARGSGNAAGIASVIGNRVRIDYTWQDGGKHGGYYQLTVEPGGRKASGRFSDDRPQKGSITMTRIASR